jgi:hypothetical protein
MYPVATPTGSFYKASLSGVVPRAMNRSSPYRDERRSFLIAAIRDLVFKGGENLSQNPST